jgi:hypothetical protein
MGCLTCRHNSRLISDGLERRLSRFEQLCLWSHLPVCGPCRGFRRFVQRLHQTAPRALSDAELSTEARQRIRLAMGDAAWRE